MDDYRKYKLKKLLDSAVDKFFGFIFYPTRKLYKDNKKFKEWINNGENKRSHKREMRRILLRVFRDIEEYGKSSILLFADTYNDMPCDRSGWDYKILTESEDWIKRNKLEVERLSFYEYIEKYYTDKLERFSWYGWHGKEDERVLVIRRISR